jgi:acyl-CoA dehydrogenase family member 9
MERPSFTRQLFGGTIDDDILFPFPRITEREEAVVSDLLHELRAFCDEHVDREWIDEHERIPDEVIEGLRRIGLFGVSLPEEYGGMGLSQSAYARVFEFITGYDVGLAIMLGVHLSLGTKGLVLAGTEAQKRRYLPKAATGEWLTSFALTEPEAGSDAAGIRTRAELSEDGSHYVIDGSKIWIGNGSFSRLIVVFAQTRIEWKGEMQDRVTAFLVEPDFPGFERGGELRKMGARGSNQCELHFREMRVPAENVLGEVGGGFKLAMRILNSGRQGLSAGAAGGVKRITEMAAAFAKEREQFGQPIAGFELIRGKLANMAADGYAAESVAYFTTGLVDRGDVEYALESAAAKVWTSEALDRAVDEMVQIAGGRGFVKGYPYERMYRDARITRIFEGTNEILRLFVGLSGIQGPAEALQEVGDALRTPIARIGVLTDFAGARLRQVLRRGEPRVEVEVDPRLRDHVDYLEEHTRDLRVAVDRAIRRHGRKIIDHQFSVARIADMAIELYVRAAVISRTQAVLEAAAKGDAPSLSIGGGEQGLDEGSIEKALRLCDLACQLSGLRFREARDGMHDERDELLNRVAEDVVGG